MNIYIAEAVRNVRDDIKNEKSEIKWKKIANNSHL